MNNKMLLSTLFVFLLLASTLPAVLALPPNGTDTSTLVIDTIGEPQTSDPAWAYDTASLGVLTNVYEPLAMCKVDRTRGPYSAVLVDQFTPMVATSWNLVDVPDYNVTYPGQAEIPAPGQPGYYPAPGTEGIDYMTINRRFYFNIRSGMPFHNGWGTLTNQDVEYSFERMLVQDRDGGPRWMLYEYLLGMYSASSPTVDPTFGEKIDYAVQRFGSNIRFNIAGYIPDITTMQINAKIGIVCRAWAQSVGRDKKGNVGDLNIVTVAGGWSNWQEIWDRYHNPPTSIIEYNEADAATKPVGTGPYQFSYWNHGSSWSITKFDSYWDGWPARVREDDPLGNNRLTGFITTVTWYLYTHWATRLSRIKNGDSDMTYVDRLNTTDVQGQPGIRCYFSAGSPQLALDAFFFTFDITTTSPYVPTFYPSGTFGTNGIPADLFNDVNARMGFAYAFNYNTWLTKVYLGEGWQPPEAVIRGLPYNRRPSDNPYAPYDEEDPTLLGSPYKYYYNLALATYYLQLAWGGTDANNDGVVEVPGALWTGGMKFTITYNAGNVARQKAAEYLTTTINSLNPNFQLDLPVAMPSRTYMRQMVNSELPLFMMGYSASYSSFYSPHNYVHPFYHPNGIFARCQKYNDQTMRTLIDAGIQATDGAVLSAIYQEIQERAVVQVPSVTLVQTVGRHFERDWMRGWYYNPSYGGGLTIGMDSTTPESSVLYVYDLWKSASQEFGDINNDGYEDIVDEGYIASHWGGAPGTIYNPSADINGGTGGTWNSIEGLVLGIPDGFINIVDRAILNANWDGD